jgi:hypothetical protein
MYIKKQDEIKVNVLIIKFYEKNIEKLFFMNLMCFIGKNKFKKIVFAKIKGICFYHLCNK